MTGVAGEWLARAKEDLAAVEKLIDDDNLTNIAAFHAQQCIEKCFKALVESSGNSVPRIHDLVRLSAIVAEGNGDDGESHRPVTINNERTMTLVSALCPRKTLLLALQNRRFQITEKPDNPKHSVHRQVCGRALYQSRACRFPFHSGGVEGCRLIRPVVSG